MSQDILEIQSLSKMEELHNEIIELLFDKYNLSIPSAVGVLELTKNEIMNNPEIFDDYEDKD